MTPRPGALARRLLQLLRHPRRRQRLALEAALVLAGLKATMTFLPYRRWQHLVAVASGGDRGSLSPDELADIVWAVDRVGRTAPRIFTCLPRALTASLMLERRGAHPALCIGVMRPAEAEVTAHAWLEVDGEVVLGSVPELDRFQRLQRWPRGGKAADSSVE
jgi:hypothetical protein